MTVYGEQWAKDLLYSRAHLMRLLSFLARDKVGGLFRVWRYVEEVAQVLKKPTTCVS